MHVHDVFALSATELDYGSNARWQIPQQERALVGQWRRRKICPLRVLPHRDSSKSCAKMDFWFRFQCWSGRSTRKKWRSDSGCRTRWTRWRSICTTPAKSSGSVTTPPSGQRSVPFWKKKRSPNNFASHCKNNCSGWLLWSGKLKCEALRRWNPCSEIGDLWQAAFKEWMPRISCLRKALYPTKTWHVNFHSGQTMQIKICRVLQLRLMKLRKGMILSWPLDPKESWRGVSSVPQMQHSTICTQKGVFFLGNLAAKMLIWHSYWCQVLCVALFYQTQTKPLNKPALVSLQEQGDSASRVVGGSDQASVPSSVRRSGRWGRAETTRHSQAEVWHAEKKHTAVW